MEVAKGSNKDPWGEAGGCCEDMLGKCPSPAAELGVTAAAKLGKVPEVVDKTLLMWF